MIIVHGDDMLAGEQLLAFSWQGVHSGTLQRTKNRDNIMVRWGMVDSRNMQQTSKLVLVGYVIWSKYRR